MAVLLTMLFPSFDQCCRSTERYQTMNQTADKKDE